MSFSKLYTLAISFLLLTTATACAKKGTTLSPFALQINELQNHRSEIYVEVLRHYAATKNDSAAEAHEHARLLLHLSIQEQMLEVAFTAAVFKNTQPKYFLCHEMERLEKNRIEIYRDRIGFEHKHAVGASYLARSEYIRQTWQKTLEVDKKLDQIYAELGRLYDIKTVSRLAA